MTGNKILLIGRSGRGKSTLANVITNTNNFRESGSSVSETKNIQFEQFADQENKFDYLIIDTPGIGDTKLVEHQVLDIIAEAVYLARDGVSQVFFVTDGRFDQFEMATYDLLRTIIFDKDITNHTTIVRTRFADFRKPEKCAADIVSMAKESQERKIKIEKNIVSKEKELVNLSADSEQYQKLSAEIEKDKKELLATNLAEVIESCQGRIVYVDNPPTEIKGARDSEIKINKNKREKSRKILLEHLTKIYQESFYKPKKLAELSEAIADDYFEYKKKKEELQKELDRLKSRENKLSSKQISQVKVSESNVSVVKDNKVELTEKNESQIEAEIGIIDTREIIAQLQNKREKLQREIETKEKVIRQKVLKHIFHNYSDINKELGGDIFLNSVIGDHDWKVIHPEFNDKGLVIKWLSQGFDYQQTREWATALRNDFNPRIDADFCAWLRDIKQLTVDKVKRRSHPWTSIEQLRQEYVVYLGEEIGVLDKHSQRLEKRDWKEIHPDFAEKSFFFKHDYQWCWEENNLTYQDARNWIPAGFRPNDYYQVKNYKDHNFAPQEVKSWLEIGLNKNDAEFANYLRLENVQPSSDLNLKEMRIKFNSWKGESKSVQEYLDQNYPKNQRKEIKKIDIALKNLPGSLDLSDFVNLEELNCYDNRITSLKLANPNRIKWINVENNYLTDLSFLKVLDSEKMTDLYIRSNNFPEQDLSVFQNFVNLEGLSINNENQEKIDQGIYNRFKGSLEFLQNLKKLERLDIDSTNITSGLEYLPDSIETFYCSADYKKDAKCKAIYNLFANDQGEVETGVYGRIMDFPRKLREYKQKIQQQQPQILQLINQFPK